LGVASLSYLRAWQVGAPLCQGNSPDPLIDGTEFIFKGGQVGDETFFVDPDRRHPYRSASPSDPQR